MQHGVYIYTNILGSIWVQEKKTIVHFNSMSTVVNFCMTYFTAVSNVKTTWLTYGIVGIKVKNNVGFGSTPCKYIIAPIIFWECKTNISNIY